mgnify:FL=1
MKKPYIICHMMTSIDGRIDCAMTSKFRGVNEYYQTLEELDVPTTVSGRVTAELEMAEPGEYVPKDTTAYGKEGFSKKTEATGYEIVVDSRGRLLWPRSEGEFGVTRMGIVGGPKINTAFLEAGLPDEISLLVGSGIDGRGGMPAVFDGLDQDHDVTGLKLMDVQKFDSDAVWLRYRV